MVDFFIGQPVIGSKIESKIGRYKYEKLRRSKQKISAALRFEQVFDVFLETYFDFEKCLADATFDDFYRSQRRQQSLLDIHLYLDEIRLLINVRALSLLSSARAYHNQRARILSEIDVGGDLTAFADREFSRAYGGSLNYRFVEALRNYAQHRSMPIETVTLAGRNKYLDKTKPDGISVYRSTIEPYTKINSLVDDQKFKKSVAKEINALGCSKIDVRAAFRSYVSSMANAHVNIRERLLPIQRGASDYIESAKQDCMRAHGVGEFNHFSAWKVGVKGQLEEIYLDQVILQKLERYQVDDGRMKYVRRGYVSTELTRNKDVYIGEFSDVWIVD